LFIFQLVQASWPLHLNDPATPMTPALAWNTAISFVTTQLAGLLPVNPPRPSVQMAGLAVQNFASAAVRHRCCDGIRSRLRTAPQQ